MAEELQSLLDKINADGVKKAQAQQEKILAEAKAKAEKIMADAKTEAERIVSTANVEADLLQQKAEQALRQAARDIRLSLRKDLEDKVQAATSALLKETLKGETLANAITAVISGYLAKDGACDDIALLASADDLAAIESAVKAKLADFLRDHNTLKAAPGVTSGFKLEFRDKDVLFDFTDESLTEAFAAFVAPKVTALLQAKD